MIIEMQLVYLIYIFEDNYNIVRDCFKIDSVNVMKRGTCSKVTKEFSIFINLAQSYQKTMKIATKNNNTQNGCKAMLVCDKLLINLKTWKSVGLMLLVIDNNVINLS